MKEGTERLQEPEVLVDYKNFLHTVKQLHIRINSGYESLHKTCMSSSQTKDSVEWEGSHRSPALAEKTLAVESCEGTKG